MKSNYIICIIIQFCSLQAYCQSSSSSADIKNRVLKVEQSLMNWVQKPDTSLKWSIEERMRYHKINGVSIAVIHNYKIEWAKGYGWADVLEKRKVTPYTLFQAASITKSINSLGVLKLVQEGKLNLDEDINEYLTSWKFPYDSLSQNKKITVRNLLNHTGGLTVSGFPGYATNDTLPTLIQILEGKNPSKTPAVRSEFEPELRYQYSGGGICIAGLIITDVSQSSYSDFMSQNILKPLQMNESFFMQPPSADKYKSLATGYYRNGSEVEGKFRIYPELPAAGLWTTPTDLCKYIIETQLSYNGSSSKVLNADLTRERLKPLGMGVFMEEKGDTQYFLYSGGNAGFMSEYWADLKNGNGVVVMLNSDNRTIIQEIINSVAYTYHWKDFYKPVIKNVISLQDSVLNRYVGDYLFGDKTLTINKKNNKLFITEDWPWEIYFTSENDFFVAEIEGNLTFQNDENGKTTGILDLDRGISATKIK